MAVQQIQPPVQPAGPSSAPNIAHSPFPVSAKADKIPIESGGFDMGSDKKTEPDILNPHQPPAPAQAEIPALIIPEKKLH